MAPFWVVGTLELEACPTTQPIVEQRRAQRRRVHTVTLAVQVSVPTSPTCKSNQHTNALTTLKTWWI